MTMSGTACLMAFMARWTGLSRIPGTGTDVVFIGRKTEDFSGRKAELTDVFG